MQANTTIECAHCGMPFEPVAEDERFCCNGCALAHRTLHAEGRDKFYELKQQTTPLRSTPFSERDFSVLEQWQATREAEARGALPSGVLELHGATCAGCVWLIENLYKDTPGADEIIVNVQSGKATLSWQAGRLDLPAFAQKLLAQGYTLSAGNTHSQKATTASMLTRRIGQCGFLAMNTMLFTLPTYLGMAADDFLAPLFRALVALFATLSLAVGGRYFIVRAIQSIRRGIIHIDLPIALGTVTAWIGSLVGWATGREALLYFDFVAIFIFLMLVGRWLQEAALERNRNRMLANAGPGKTVILSDASGTETEAPVESLVKSNRVSIPRGGYVPACGRLLSGSANVSLEWINGESEPRAYATGALVPAGALNIGSDPLHVEAIEGWKDSALARLLESSADEAADPFLSRLLKIYLYIVIVLAVGGCALWAATSSWVTGLQVFISVLVVSCPCSLGLAIPLAGELGLSRLKRAGVFVKAGNLFRRLKGVRCIVFDKTGTLTLENPRLANPAALDALPADARRALACLVSQSLHPVSRTLREELRVRETTANGIALAPGSLTEHPGFGLSAEIDDTTWSLGRPGWIPGVNGASENTNGFDCELRRSGQTVAQFQFTDALRDGAKDALQRFQSLGLDTAIISGDRQEKVDRLAGSLDLDTARALGGLTPEQKAEWIRTHSPDAALMVGDGLNDALAFDAAAVRGTPVIDKGLLEPRADFFFLDRGLDGIHALFSTTRWHTRTVRNIFLFAVIYNLAAVSLCLAALMTPLLAAILMPLSSLATIGLALR